MFKCHQYIYLYDKNDVQRAVFFLLPVWKTTEILKNDFDYTQYRRNNCTLHIDITNLFAAALLSAYRKQSIFARKKLKLFTSFQGTAGDLISGN